MERKMINDLLPIGIRKFQEDRDKLKQMIRETMESKAEWIITNCVKDSLENITYIIDCNVNWWIFY